MQPYNVAALALRLVIAIDFITGGWNSVRDPVGRGKVNGVPPAFMAFLGTAISSSRP